MFKLGEYDEFDAAEIADYLKEAGVKVDLRPSISAVMDSAVYLEGRKSQLVERIEDFEVYDRYIEALKTAIAEGLEGEEFTDRYLCHLDPSWKGKMDEIAEFMGEGSIALEGEPGSPDEIIDRAAELFEMLEALQFLDGAIELNEIEIGKGANVELGDDPLLRIAVESDSCDPEDELTKAVLSVHLEKTVEVRLDELTTPLAKDVDDEFADEYPEEYYKICSIGMTVERLLEPPGDSNKIDIDEFSALLVFEEDMENLVMTVDGTAVAEDIAKALKKEGVIKIKGDKIVWKR
ncbi:MAG TPA: hypothetical protein PLQ49_03490 [Methanothrix sp.]|nr:hypothetical protein [Methanothrix sp.]HRW82393.1 hypothetical protein [Methanothrix sp.]